MENTIVSPYLVLTIVLAVLFVAGWVAYNKLSNKQDEENELRDLDEDRR